MNVVISILWVAVTVACVGGILFYLNDMRRISHVTEQLLMIVDAIGDYRKDCIMRGETPRLDFPPLERFKRAMDNPFLWDAEKALKEWELEIIRPYLEQRGKKYE